MGKGREKRRRKAKKQNQRTGDEVARAYAEALVRGAEIFYTTDNTTPTTSSLKYVGPLTVSEGETVRAIAKARLPGFGVSDVVGATYYCAPQTSPPALWGFADLHVHPASTFAFGAGQNGNGGVFWGKPGGVLSGSSNLTAIRNDLAACAPADHSGFTLDFVQHPSNC